MTMKTAFMAEVPSVGAPGASALAAAGPALVSGPRRRVLMLSFEAGRWALTRLIGPLRQAGLQVGVLCPEGNALAASAHLDWRFTLPDARSSRSVARALATAAREVSPCLILPGDERAVACLQAIVRKPAAYLRLGLDAALFSAIAGSLGRPDRFEAMLLKSETLRLAAALGIRTPRTKSVTSIEQAITCAEAFGFPVYLKAPFGWAGIGVVRCEDESGLRQAFAALARPPGSPIRAWTRRLLGRDWYPHPETLEVQQAIVGTPGMVAASALDGRMLAAFFGETLETTTPTGPSCVVRVGPNEQAEAISQRMIESFGASGFIGFDFIVEAATGRPYLIECNPRAIPVSHLGERIGADLCASLAAALAGEPVTAARATRREVVALFPQAWLRSPAHFAYMPYQFDAPWDDPPLLRAMLGQPTAEESTDS